MRYFLRLAYRGSSFCGWQRQPDQPSVQEHVEDKLSMLLREPIAVTGCGRTDAGVHASEYFLHFDAVAVFPPYPLRRLNQVLGPDVACYGLGAMRPEGHARFDALSRTYTYELSFRKDPFRQGLTYYYPYPERPDLERMRSAARILPAYEAFFPFCRSKSDARHMRCKLWHADWSENGPDQLTFRIRANRFLRGMVRLIVGMCVEVGLGKMELDEVQRALDRQERLPRPVSAPPEGLFLSGVEYPYPVP